MHLGMRSETGHFYSNYISTSSLPTLSPLPFRTIPYKNPKVLGTHTNFLPSFNSVFRYWIPKKNWALICLTFTFPLFLLRFLLLWLLGPFQSHCISSCIAFSYPVIFPNWNKSSKYFLILLLSAYLYLQVSSSILTILVNFIFAATASIF